jgi:hypothetical protein
MRHGSTTSRQLPSAASSQPRLDWIWIGILRRNHRQPHFSETNPGRPQPMPTDAALALHLLCTRSLSLSLAALVPAAQHGSNVASCRSPIHGRDGVCDD